MNALAQFRPGDSEPLDPVFLCAAFDACPVALAVVENARVVHANAAFARTFATAGGSSVVGKTLAELLPEHDGTARPELQALTGKFSVQGRNLQIVSAPAGLRVMSAQELGRSQRLESLGRLVSGVAHDFNNLLTGVLLCGDLLLSKLETSSPLRGYAAEMKAAAAQGSVLVQQLLAVVAREPAEPALLSWNTVVESMRGLLARLIGENIELATDLASGLHCVQMDLAEAQQIVLNLVLNARDAMPNGGRIQLATRNCPPRPVHDFPSKAASLGGIEFEVSDTGCGMEECVRAAVFEPFFTTKPVGQGNGVGLATVKGIVDRYAGTIVIASQPGKGTQVTIGLPAARTGAADVLPLWKGTIL